MHYFAPDKNFWGGHGIVGGQIPLGVGLAYGLKYKGHKGCCAVLHGRRRGQPGCRPRVLQSRRALESAGRLRHRKQRLLDGHLSGAFLRRPRCLAERGRGLRHGWDIVQRPRSLRGPRQDRTSPSSSPAKKSQAHVSSRSTPTVTADTPSPTLTKPTALARRSRTTRPTRTRITLFQKRARSTRKFSPKSSSTEIDDAARAEAEHAAEFAEASPFPDRRGHPERRLLGGRQPPTANLARAASSSTD